MVLKEFLRSLITSRTNQTQTCSRPAVRPLSTSWHLTLSSLSCSGYTLSSTCWGRAISGAARMLTRNIYERFLYTGVCVHKYLWLETGGGKSRVKCWPLDETQEWIWWTVDLDNTIFCQFDTLSVPPGFLLPTLLPLMLNFVLPLHST